MQLTIKVEAGGAVVEGSVTVEHITAAVGLKLTSGGNRRELGAPADNNRP